MTISRRDILVGSTMAAFATRLPAAPPAASVRIQRLAWAGIRLQHGEASLFIDALINPEAWGEHLPDRLVPIEPSAENYALITHRHPDHFDPKAIHAALGSSGTLVYAAAAGPPAIEGVKLRSASLWEPQLLGDFTVAAVPAVDGYGDPQVSWVVSVAGKRFIHCGDTMWHGAWWHIGRQFGPFDAAFLPVNGARFYWRQPVSEQPAVMTAEQAIAAAIILGARQLVPIHFGVRGEPGYAEYEGAVERLQNEARRRGGVKVTPMQPGEWMSVG